MIDNRNRIKILPDELVNVIAAGEVVERPASVVKELVENALDAGARRIEVRLEDGGRRKIVVSDDGVGMDEESALLAIERHATSKITAVDDLRHIRTLGFRGEALPSIAAVGRFTLETWDGDSGAGTRVEMDGGRLKGVQPCGRARGTTVALEGIFRQLPARRKFMRSRETETAWCLRSVEDAALSRPDVHFEMIHDGVGLLSMPPVDSLRERVAPLWGVEEAARMLSVRHSGEGIRLEGLISPPTITFSRRSRHRVLLNRRPLKDPVLNGLISAGLAGIYPQGRFPALVLALEIEDDLVDINVHPSKREVRIRRPDSITSAVRESLTKVEGPVRPPHRYLPAAEKIMPVTPPAAEGTLPFGRGAGDPGHRGGQGALPAEGQTPGPGPGDMRILGQIMGTFILVAGPEGLTIVDQHAAHERLVYNRLMARRSEQGAPSQRLAVPLLLEMGPSEVSGILALRKILESFGFEIDPFGDSTMRVTAVPADLPGAIAEELLRQLAADPDPAKRVPDEVALAISRWACRQSVTAGKRMSGEQMSRLLADLEATDSGLTCPHGRPTRVTLTRSDLERLFGRQ
ncbi:MAG: DNA mismatch repair endonuclease MutL [bacterium]|nr:MAG: DNA mismatch repair endonuclease MutL [bacterium]